MASVEAQYCQSFLSDEHHKGEKFHENVLTESGVVISLVTQKAGHEVQLFTVSWQNDFAKCA